MPKGIHSSPRNYKGPFKVKFIDGKIHMKYSDGEWINPHHIPKPKNDLDRERNLYYGRLLYWLKTNKLHRKDYDNDRKQKYFTWVPFDTKFPHMICN